MRFIVPVVLALLVGCSAAPTSQSDTGRTDPTPSYGGSNGGDSVGSGGPCDQVTTVLVDGGIITVPDPCATGWQDPSDPPPDVQKKWIVDPDPNEQAGKTPAIK